MSQSIPSLTTYSPPPPPPANQEIHAWGPGFAHTYCPWGPGFAHRDCPWGQGFDGSGEVAEILHTGLIHTQNRFFSTHIEYDTVALTTKTFMHLRMTVPFVTAHLEIFHCTHHPVIPKSGLYFTFCSSLNALSKRTSN